LAHRGDRATGINVSLELLLPFGELAVAGFGFDNTFVLGDEVCSRSSSVTRFEADLLARNVVA
jgi:hypothetical protein